MAVPGTHGGTGYTWRYRVHMVVPGTHGGTGYTWWYRVHMAVPGTHGGTGYTWRKNALINAKTHFLPENEWINQKFYITKYSQKMFYQ